MANGNNNAAGGNPANATGNGKNAANATGGNGANGNGKNAANAAGNNNNFGGNAGKKAFGTNGYEGAARKKYLKNVKRTKEALNAFVKGKKNIRFNNFANNIKLNNVPVGPLTQNNNQLISNYNYNKNAQALGNGSSNNFKYNEATIKGFIPDDVKAIDLANKFEKMNENIATVATVFEPFNGIIGPWGAVAGALRGPVFGSKFKANNIEKINGVNAPHGGFFLRKMGNYGNKNNNNTKKIQNDLKALNAKLSMAPNKMLSIKANEQGKFTVVRIVVIRYLFYVIRMMIKIILAKKKTNLNKAKIFVNATKKLQNKLTELKSAEAGAKVSNAIGFNRLLINLVTSVKTVVNSPEFKNFMPKNNSNGWNLPVSTEFNNNNNNKPKTPAVNGPKNQPQTPAGNGPKNNNSGAGVGE